MGFYYHASVSYISKVMAEIEFCTERQNNEWTHNNTHKHIDQKHALDVHSGGGIKYNFTYTRGHDSIWKCMSKKDFQSFKTKNDYNDLKFLIHLAQKNSKPPLIGGRQINHKSKSK